MLNCQRVPHDSPAIALLIDPEEVTVSGTACLVATSVLRLWVQTLVA